MERKEWWITVRENSEKAFAAVFETDVGPVG